MSVKKRALGICLGASTVSMAHVELLSDEGKQTQRVVNSSLHAHGGDPKTTLVNALQNIDLESFDHVAVTGRRFHKLVNLTSIPEPHAVEYAYKFLKPEGVSCPAVVSAGGETFMVYVLDKKGQIANVLTGNKCASGTGEFFMQQLRRMNVTLDDIHEWEDDVTPHHVSGRCSVFCKSDCTHATNKGVPRAMVTAGLCVMMANKVLELLKKVDRRNIMIAGGTALNHMMIRNLEKEIPGLIVPDEAPYFEALGAALWAFDHETTPFRGMDRLFKAEKATFESLPPLRDFEHMVEFKTIEMDTVKPGDVCLMGLDVGSTTTKAVLLRKSDFSILASVYLRTNGDPVGASRACYRSIREHLAKSADPSDISIVGLGICGSGRQIAGLHALTDGVINEIIAHAAAAVHFDPKVDTIFEIGGQDAKYTYVTNGVSSDYAMNEACSAGTGSFLEESAYESMGVTMEEIANIALKGHHPPNFNDQCAAFISSDIKNAIHEGVSHEDIIAGLVYSICMNYSNRVKGNRPVGEKVFMQGGVCYNQAIPLAMASLVGKPIIVPPEPGLMGAFGVALEVGKRLDSGLIEEKTFDLDALIQRDVHYGKSFVCGGGPEKCDRRCKIAMIHLEGEKYPFGGACNRYYNLRHNLSYDVKNLDLVRFRQHLVFEKYAAKLPAAGTPPRGRVAINRSFLTSTYYPLYSTFFAELGLIPVMPDAVSQEGVDRRSAPFCYPAELSHGFFHSLLNMADRPDYIFLPHFKSVPSQNRVLNSQVCPFVQGETFFLRTTFKDELTRLQKQGTELLTPLIDMNRGMRHAKAPLVDAMKKIGISEEDTEAAFRKALTMQEACEIEMKEVGKKVLTEIEKNPQETAVVLFGRPYNGFVDEANMGIPHKLASRGVRVIPFDFLDYEKQRSKRHMYWGLGQRLLKAARVVEHHPQLFGTYITNFSCGPDSFVIGYFRSIMGKKPSLTLELDSHTADAGLETRIEAFLDIVTAYRQLEQDHRQPQEKPEFEIARMRMKNGCPKVRTSTGKLVPLNDPRVTLLLPSMGRLSSESLAAVFRSEGIRTYVHPPSDEAVLKIGRANTSCKECLPLILTTGTLLNYIEKEKKEDEIVVYFMPTGSGPCRFGQYYIFMEDLLKRLELPDVALFSLSSENGYYGMGNSFFKRGWWGVIISDDMEDIRSMLLTNAVDTAYAMSVFEEQWECILKELERGTSKSLMRQLAQTAKRLKAIPQKQSPDKVPTIYLAGEIFVRRDALSRRYITESLAEKGFAVVCSPIAEWVRYADYLLDHNLVEGSFTGLKKLEFAARKWVMTRSEKKIKSALSASGMTHGMPIDIGTIVKNASPHISLNLAGEAILTIGSSLTEVVSHACGVIAIGPFGCMPNRLSESILNETMNRKTKIALPSGNGKATAILKDIDELPFLAIESDGSPFPQLINAKLETFCIRAERLHERMAAYDG